MLTEMMSATAMAPPASWVPVSSTNPCEQTSIALCEQAAAPWTMRRNSHPPIMTAARPAIARAAALHDCSLRGASVGRSQVPARWQRGRCGRVAV